MKNKKGFTLIELLVTIAIISLLSSIVFASLSSAREKSIETKNIVQGKEIEKSLELSRLSNGSFPISTSDHIDDIKEGENTLMYKPYSRLIAGSLEDVPYGEYGELDAVYTSPPVYKDTVTNEELDYRVLYNVDDLVNNGTHPESEFSLSCMSFSDVSSKTATELGNIKSKDTISYTIVKRPDYGTDYLNEKRLVLIRRSPGDSYYGSSIEHWPVGEGFVDTDLGYLGLENLTDPYLQEYQMGGGPLGSGEEVRVYNLFAVTDSDFNYMKCF